MLIVRADLGDATPSAMRIAEGRIAAVGARLVPRAGEEVFDARGGAVLPGLHDHHIHLLALAAALDSLRCGPPQHHDAESLRAALRRAAAARPGAWLRGIGYHESVAGDIDRDWIDAVVECVPVRIQHRSGRLWILNSRALAALGVGEGTHDTPLQRRAGRLTGRLYDADAWLRARIGGQWPDLRRASDALARRGVTGVSDAGVDNGPREHAHVAAQQACGRLQLDVLMMGSAALSAADAAGGSQMRSPTVSQTVSQTDPQTGLRMGLQMGLQMGLPRGLQAAGQAAARADPPGAGGAGGAGAAAPARARLRVGPTKLYLREIALPAFDALCAEIRCSHASGRAVAIHCVTLAELVFAAEALRAVAARPGDRIEHASLCTPQALGLLGALGVSVVTQPHFVFERGDAYLAELSAEEAGWLYRGRSFLAAGVALAAGSDAPYGEADPWRAMAAAVRRETRGGARIGAAEALSPQEALRLFLGDPWRPGTGTRTLGAGRRADLCVLDRPWAAMLADLAAVQVRLTLRGGEPIWTS